MKGIMKYAVSTLLTNCKLGTHLLCLEILEAENADMAVGAVTTAALKKNSGYYLAGVTALRCDQAAIAQNTHEASSA
jgi:hypothetical protein